MRVSVSVFGRFHAFYLAHQLERRGHLRQLITSYPRYEVQKYGIPGGQIESILWPELARRLYFRFPKALRGSDWALHWLAERFDAAAARRLDPDVDLVVGWSSFAERTLLAARSLGAKTIVERGSYHIEFQRDILVQEYARFNAVPHLPHAEVVAKELREYEIADAICVPSEFARQSFLDKGIDRNKVLVVPYGVSLPQFPPREELPKTFRAIYVGGMTLQKGVHYLLKAWAGLKIPNGELWLVGSKTPEIEPFFRKYEGYFRYFGHVPQAELHRLYAQCTVFVICSIQDGLAMVIPQAMACGLPVICTTNTGGPGLVSDGREGYVIPIRSVDAIRARLTFMYENPALCTEMGLQARRRVEEYATWDSYGDRIARAYESVLGANGAGGAEQMEPSPSLGAGRGIS